jgi:hypothetical protein
MAGRRKRIVDTTGDTPQPIDTVIDQVVEQATGTPPPDTTAPEAEQPRKPLPGRHSRTASFGARIFTRNEPGSPFVRHGQDPHRGEQILLFSEPPPPELKKQVQDLGYRYQPVEKYWTRSDDAPLPEDFKHPTDYGKHVVETIGNQMRAENGLEPATLSYVRGRGY